MVSAGMTCVKYILFCFNLVFAITGIAILCLGVLVHIVYAHYQNLVYNSLYSTPLVLIAIGIVIFVVAFCGCCGAAKESHCMIITFSVLLLVIFTLELAAGIVVYIRRNDVENMLETKLNTTMYDYYRNENYKNTWDILQHEAECCGLYGPSDWNLVNHNGSLPHTCCPNAPDDGSCHSRSLNKHTDACFAKLKTLFIKYGFVIGCVGLGIAGAQLLGVLFACCLARSIKEEYETV